MGCVGVFYKRRSECNVNKTDIIGTLLFRGAGTYRDVGIASPHQVFFNDYPRHEGRLSPKFWLVPTKFVDTPLPLIFVYECDVQGVELVKK